MAAAGNIPQQAQPFERRPNLACCGIYGIGGFPFDAPSHDAYTQQQLENLENQLKANDAPMNFTNGGAQIATVNRNQKRAKEMLLAHGFVEVAKFQSAHGPSSGDIILLLRGATVEKIIKKKKSSLKDKPGL